MKIIIRIGAASLQRAYTRIAIFARLLLALLGFSAPSSAETVRLYFDPATPQIAFAAGDIKAALEKQSYTVQTNNLSALTNDGSGKRIILALTNDSSALSILSAQGGASVPGLGTQAYALRTTTTNSYLSYWVVGGDAVGAMYGGLQIAENITFNGFNASYYNQESPYLLYRGMKLNLPLDKRIPTYVGGWSSHSAQVAISNVWDMTFWTKLIDQQARNRYNFLSVWVHHPFPALVKTPDYPNASLPNIQLYDGTFLTSLTYTQRVAFWRQVMQYAHSRGMKFYFFDWNIYVDYASTAYPALTTSASNPTTINYLYESMQALLATYPELDGFGITTGDGMSGTSAENTTWSWNAYGKAVYDYLTNNAARQFNLIHRGVGSDPTTCYSTYAPLLGVTNATFNTSAKYAMAHMYSATAPTWTGDINTSYNLGQKTFITVRNDDYFYINWGDPKFVRDFMTGIPHKDPTVRGMYIGSDGYNPSRTYFCKDASQNGQLEVERRWYMEMLWGRISYNTNISDAVFQNMLAQRYPTVSSSNLFNAWSLASRSLPKVTELIMKDWNLDFHWYPEGCYSDPGRGTGFRTISSATGATGGFAGQDVANGSALCNIANSAAGTCGSKKSSYQLADEMEADAANALALINPLLAGTNAELNVAINNVKQMAYLSAYYAHKIRGATYNLAGNTALARDEMGQAYCSWISYSRSMDETYYGDSFRNLSVAPDWKFADAAVLKEYTDLGGVGIPSCDNLFTLTTSATNGSIGLTPSGGIYSTGAVVTVTASPNFGYAFGNWGGDLSGSVSPATITMNTNKNVTANFVVSTGDPMPWVETFTLADGIKSHGAPTSWTATRSSGLFQVAGNRFMINGATGQGVLETAEINIPGGSVKVSLEVQGAGGLDTGDYVRFYKIVDGGSPVQIGQTITGGFTGTNTLVGTNVTGSKLKLRIETSVSASDEYYYFDNLKAEYEVSLPTFTLATSATNGSIALNPSGGTYTTGTVVMVTAMANGGYAFSNWSGDLRGSVNPTNLTMNGNKSVTANFASVPTYTLTTGSTNGSIALNPPGGIYNTGTVVTVTATPNSGYTFSNWSGNLSGSVNPTNLTMNGNKSVTASFTPVPTYTITVVSTNLDTTMGSSPRTNVFTVPSGDANTMLIVTVTGEAREDTATVTWNPTGFAQQALTMSSAKAVSTNSTSTTSSGSAVVFYLANPTPGAGNVIATCSAVTRYSVNVIYATGVSQGAPEAAANYMTNNSTLFETSYITPSAGALVVTAFGSSASGNTYPNYTNRIYNSSGLLAGQTSPNKITGLGSQAAMSYNVVADSTQVKGHFDSTGTGSGDGQAVTIASFAPAAPVQYTLTTNAVNGTITLNPTGGVYTGGTVVAVTANPDSGYTFSGWSGDLSGSVSPTNITMNANKSVTANFSVQSISFLPPVLQGGQLRLEWTGGGTLQTANSVAGPWNDVSGAVSPYLTPPTNPAQYFRVKQ